jgi:glycosyltransferase involved in cell wall biosynthesis
LSEVVDSERTALVAEPSGQEFAVMMLRLMNDEVLRRNLGEAGRHEVEQRFSARRMVENTIRVYEDVLEKKQVT